MTLFRRREASRGQVVLITLLIMVIVLTVGLTLVARSLTEKQSSTSTEQSERAFSAAEAGIEDALGKTPAELAALAAAPDPTGGSFQTGSTYNYKVTPENNEFYEPNKRIDKDDVVQIVLSEGANTVSSVYICWVSEDPADTALPANKASLEVTVVDKPGAAYGVNKWAFNATPRGNGFIGGVFPGCSGATATTPKHTYQHYTDTINLNPATNPMIMRIKPLYNGTYLAVHVTGGGGGLPTQAYRIESTGTVGNTTRSVLVQEPIKPPLPSIFDHVLFNGSSGSTF